MKKIGLLTLPLKTNYGGTLQAFALYQFLKSQHFNVQIIQKNAFRSTWKRILVNVFERIPYQDFKGYRSNYINTKFHRSFIDRHLPEQTQVINNYYQLKKVTKDAGYDAVIVGSDQVWRMDYIDDGFYESYFLDFVDNPSTKKIAYAASFGKDHWQAPDKIEKITHLLSKFHAISTRESSGVKVCSETFSSPKCTQVLDPTLLLDRSFFEAVLEQPPASSKMKLLNYVLDGENYKDSILKDTAAALGEGYAVSSIYNPGQKHQTYTTEQWLGHFATADFVITDSFHGMVFSIIFNKNFLVIANKERGLSRFTSLLKVLNLESRLIIDGSAANIPNIISRIIDYSDVEIKLSALRDYSKKYLENSLI